MTSLRASPSEATLMWLQAGSSVSHQYDQCRKFCAMQCICSCHTSETIKIENALEIKEDREKVLKALREIPNIDAVCTSLTTPSSLEVNAFASQNASVNVLLSLGLNPYSVESVTNPITGEIVEVKPFNISSPHFPTSKDQL
jgi:hypothetical protein